MDCTIGGRGSAFAFHVMPQNPAATPGLTDIQKLLGLIQDFTKRFPQAEDSPRPDIRDFQHALCEIVSLGDRCGAQLAFELVGAFNGLYSCVEFHLKEGSANFDDLNPAQRKALYAALCTLDLDGLHCTMLPQVLIDSLDDLCDRIATMSPSDVVTATCEIREMRDACPKPIDSRVTALIGRLGEALSSDSLIREMDLLDSPLLEAFAIALSGLKLDAGGRALHIAGVLWARCVERIEQLARDADPRGEFVADALNMAAHLSEQFKSSGLGTGFQVALNKLLRPELVCTANWTEGELVRIHIALGIMKLDDIHPAIPVQIIKRRVAEAVQGDLMDLVDSVIHIAEFCADARVNPLASDAHADPQVRKDLEAQLTQLNGFLEFAVRMRPDKVQNLQPSQVDRLCNALESLGRTSGAFIRQTRAAPPPERTPAERFEWKIDSATHLFGSISTTSDTLRIVKVVRRLAQEGDVGRIASALGRLRAPLTDVLFDRIEVERLADSDFEKLVASLHALTLDSLVVPLRAKRFSSMLERISTRNCPDVRDVMLAVFNASLNIKFRPKHVDSKEWFQALTSRNVVVASRALAARLPQMVGAADWSAIDLESVREFDTALHLIYVVGNNPVRQQLAARMREPDIRLFQDAVSAVVRLASRPGVTVRDVRDELAKVTLRARALGYLGGRGMRADGVDPVPLRYALAMLLEDKKVTRWAQGGELELAQIWDSLWYLGWGFNFPALTEAAFNFRVRECGEWLNGAADSEDVTTALVSVGRFCSDPDANPQFLERATQALEGPMTAARARGLVLERDLVRQAKVQMGKSGASSPRIGRRRVA